MEAAAAGVAILPGAIRLVKSSHHHQYQSSSCPATSFGCTPVVRARRWIRASGFRDSGHLGFYCKAKRGGGALVTGKDKKKKEAKKKEKAKLLQGLSEDLSTLTQMDTHLLGSQGEQISEAALALMKHLQQLQADDKDQMRKEKENNGNPTMVDCESSSSSSSESSSSDDECCDQVIGISSFRDCATSVAAAAAQPTAHLLLGPEKSTSVPTLEAHGSMAIHGLQHRASVSLNDEVNTTSAGGTGNSMKRIEVCMGNKCKKSGSATLLEEFGRAVGVSGAVVGCKCMGKCRDGPNVRLFNSLDDGGADVSATAPPNPLFLGVALEDVDIIVANFFAQELGMSPSF